MEVRRELVPTKRSTETQAGLAVQIFSPAGPMAMEHARQSVWEQGAVGMLCAVGGYLLAYWSMQGFIGLAVIVLCIAFSTLVTAALCHYYDRAVQNEDRTCPDTSPTRQALAPG